MPPTCANKRASSLYMSMKRDKKRWEKGTSPHRIDVLELLNAGVRTCRYRLVKSSVSSICLCRLVMFLLSSTGLPPRADLQCIRRVRTSALPCHVRQARRQRSAARDSHLHRSGHEHNHNSGTSAGFEIAGKLTQIHRFAYRPAEPVKIKSTRNFADDVVFGTKFAAYYIFVLQKSV